MPSIPGIRSERPETTEPLRKAAQGAVEEGLRAFEQGDRRGKPAGGQQEAQRVPHRRVVVDDVDMSPGSYESGLVGCRAG